MNKIMLIMVPVARYRERLGSLCMDDRRFLPEVLRVIEKVYGVDGALYIVDVPRERSESEQYFSASWMAFNRNDRIIAIKYLMKSWLLWHHRLTKEKNDKFFRLKLLVRYLFGKQE